VRVSRREFLGATTAFLGSSMLPRMTYPDERITSGKERTFFNTTDPEAIYDPKRNFTVEELHEKFKNEPWYKRMIARVRYHASTTYQLEHAKERLGLDKETYLNLFVVSENAGNRDYRGKIARIYVPPKPEGKPMFLLFNGNGEKVFASENRSGISYIFNRIKEANNAIVMQLRPSFVMDQLGAFFTWTGKYAYQTDVLFRHRKTIIEDVIDMYHPSRLGLGGFSMGGGDIDELSKKNDILGENGEATLQGVPIANTVYIDAIQPGVCKLGAPVSDRPYFDNPVKRGHYHTVYYQIPPGQDNILGGTTTMDLIELSGAPPRKPTYKKVGIPFTDIYTWVKWDSKPDIHPGDLVKRIYGTGHNSIDTVVREEAYKRLILGMT